MINQDVIDLYSRLQGGEKVIVLTASGEMPKGLYIPKPPAPKVAAKTKVAAPAPAAVVPAGTVPTLKVLPPPSIAVGTAPAVEAAAPAPAVAPADTAAPGIPLSPTDNSVSVTCAVPLVNGACPPGKETN
jgi:hypothetical protein